MRRLIAKLIAVIGIFGTKAIIWPIDKAVDWLDRNLDDDFLSKYRE